MSGSGLPAPERRLGVPSGRSDRTELFRDPPGARFKAPDACTPPRMATVEVRLDSWLREFGPRGRERLEADSVEHLLDALEQKYPRLRFKLRDETGQLRRYVRVFVDGEDVSGTTGASTPLGDARTIDILHSIAGG